MDDRIIEYCEDVRAITTEFFTCARDGILFKPYKRRIVPSMYQAALNDFMLFGQVTRYPAKKILQWKEFVLYNIALLRAFTDIWGHSTSCPYEEFNDVFYYNQDTGELDKEITTYTEYDEALWKNTNADDMSPRWSNGQDLISDYAIDPLEKLGFELMLTEDPTQILILLNRIMNITHPRSDIAELFMVGGSMSMTDISN